MAHGVAVVGKGDLIGLSIAVAVCVAMRLAILPACNDLGHDEAITLLAATAHLDDFGRSDLRTDWVEVDRWKRLLALDEGATPSAIWRGLAKYDIHPPVYFWACNLWMRVVDAEPIGLRGFHVGCDVVSITLLFSLLKILGRSISEATAVAGAWSVGFPAVIASLE